MARLSVGARLRVLKEPIMELAEHFGVQPSKRGLVDTQWQNLTQVGWASTADTIAFWSEVLAYRDAAGSNPFHELTVDVLSLPHSNTEVESVFSQLSVVKTRHKNSLSTASTNTVLSVRSGLRRLGKCCYTYALPDSDKKGWYHASVLLSVRARKQCMCAKQWRVCRQGRVVRWNCCSICHRLESLE